MLEISQGLMHTELLLDAGDTVIEMQPECNCDDIAAGDVADSADGACLLDSIGRGIRLVDYSDSDQSVGVLDDSDAYSPQVTSMDSFAAEQMASAEGFSGICDDTAEKEDGDCVIENLEANSSDEAVEDSQQGNEQGIHITVYSKPDHGKGKDRKMPCFYCDAHVYHMPRHLRRKHGSETRVAAVIERPSAARLGLQYITNLGVFKHNSQVLQDGDGILIVARSPKLSRAADDFLPCQFCLQFYVKGELYRHCGTCRFRVAGSPDRGFLSAGRALLLGSLNSNVSRYQRDLQTHVISRMRTDRVTRAATSENLIIRLGSLLLQKLGPKRALDISAWMRALGRLQIRLSQSGQVSLQDCISGRCFDHVMEAIEAEGGSYIHTSGRRLFRSPGYVLKAGSAMLKCAHLKRGMALRSGDSTALKEADDYITLHGSEYTDRASSAAHASLRMKGNTLSEFPDECDLRKLKWYLKKEMSHVLTQLHDHADATTWRELAELTMSRLIVFNARRGSEAAELTWEEYSHATSDVDSALSSSFSTVERQLLGRYMVTITCVCNVLCIYVGYV